MAGLNGCFSGGSFRRLCFADVPAGLWLSLLAAVQIIMLYQRLQLLLAGAVPQGEWTVYRTSRDALKALAE